VQHASYGTSKFVQFVSHRHASHSRVCFGRFLSVAAKGRRARASCRAWACARQIRVLWRQLHRHVLQIWSLSYPAALHPRYMHARQAASTSAADAPPPGREGAGVVVSAPSDSGFSTGDRVACLTPGNASYAQFVAVPCSSCVKVPDAVPLNLACAALLQGLTAVVLTRRVYPVAAGDTVLVHAAAGGTGSLVLQACTAAGATGAFLCLLIRFAN
jgi:hypothetical protein